MTPQYGVDCNRAAWNVAFGIWEEKDGAKKLSRPNLELLSPLAMDLREFVGQTLVQIIQGVVDAKQGKISGARINPKLRHTLVQECDTDHPRWRLEPEALKAVGLLANEDGTEVVDIIEFDVAVTVEAETSEGSEKKEGGSAGLRLHVASAGIDSHTTMDKKESQIRSDVSRVKFRIPVQFPS